MIRMKKAWKAALAAEDVVLELADDAGADVLDAAADEVFVLEREMDRKVRVLRSRGYAATPEANALKGNRRALANLAMALREEAEMNRK